MKILFFTSWYPSKEHPLKGIFIKEHCTAIKNTNNIQIVVLVLNVGYSTKFFDRKTEVFFDENEIETHVLNIKSRFYKWLFINIPLLFIFCNNYLRKHLLSHFKPDILHSNVLNPAGIVGYLISDKYKFPHVITEHWSKVDKFISKNIFSLLGKKAFNNAISVTVVSDFLKNKLMTIITDHKKISVIPNVVDTDIYYFKPKKQSTNELTFTAVATWILPKRPMLFVQALEKIQKNTRKKIVLNIVGEGILLEEIKNITPSLSYAINFCGKKSKNDLAKILQESDYFLHASDIETFSIVVAEALSTGTPVIASNAGALPELIHDKNGVLCNNNIDEWEAAITQAISINYDNLSISIENHLKFRPEVIGDMFKKIYQTAV